MIFLVKGVSRRVIVIKSPDPHMFEEAIFIVKEDALHKGVTQEEIIREAQDVANNYVKKHVTKSRIPSMPAPLFAVFGAVTTAAVWIAAQFIL